MANYLVSRKQPDWYVVGMLPNVNLTPMGGIPIPVPYPASANLQEAVHTTASVNVNGYSGVVFDASCVVHTVGGEAGVSGGVKSGTVAESTWPMQCSSTVRFMGKQIVRDNDLYWMNGPYTGQEP
ncbi:DUF4150 domain-containing protein [Pseudomonas nicosulfuronedens]